MMQDMQQWVVSGLHNGASVEQLRTILLKAGFSARVVDRELASIAPYITAASEVKEKGGRAKISLEKYEALMKTLDYQMRSLPLYLNPPRVKLPHLDRFLQEYYYPNRLGIFTSVLDNCEAKDWTPQHLANKVGKDTVVEIQYGIQANTYEQTDAKYKKEVTFGEFASWLEDPAKGSNFYMTAFNLKKNKEALQVLHKDIQYLYDNYLTSEVEDSRVNFFIGPEGTVAPFHYDLLNILYVQVYGRKLIRLIPSLQVPYIYNHKTTYSDVDVLNPDLTKYPEFAKATLIEFEIGPGEAFFLPLGWGHHITSLSPSISLSCTNIRTQEGFENMFVGRKKAYGY